MIREKTDAGTLSPMMRQYFAMKEKYAREIIFFRMGDFYEMFFDDARTASEILGIALTSRSKDKDAIPMAGVPVRAVDSYLPRLLKAGKRVAICEQIEDSRDAKGLVERDVIRVISPGTVTDEKIVGEKVNNFIAAIVAGKTGFGLAWLDVTTGQFLVWESPDASGIATELARLDPAECVLPEALAATLDRTPQLERALRESAITPFPDPAFDRDAARRALTGHFRVTSLAGFGCEEKELAIRAGGGLLAYVTETQKAFLKHITRASAFEADRHVTLDHATRRALEITESLRGNEREGTLLSVFDSAASALGARKIREWLLAPLRDVAAIVERQDAVEEIAADDGLGTALAGVLEQVHDLERICTRISYRSAGARDLVALRRTLEVVPELRALLAERRSTLFGQAAALLAEPPGLAATIAATLVDEPPLSTKEGGLIRKGHDPDLDELREIATQGTLWIARFQEEEIRKTGIPSLKVGFNKVFGYYLEVTNPHREKIPGHYVRKQTLKNCERFVTADLKEYEAKVLNARERSMAMEFEIFSRLRDAVSEHMAALQSIAGAAAEVDALATFARHAVKRGYVRPVVNGGLRLCIEDGRHPVLEALAGKEPFVPNSTDLDADRHIMVITGPNMAGKSTYIRQVALLTLLAQTGSFIPARSAEIGAVDRIFTRVGAADDLMRGQSTFMVEMSETANILNHASPRSLLVLDEVGRGTSTFDGVSIAWAITEYIAERIGARTLFATHYHELTGLARSFPAIRNFNCAVKEWNEDIIFLRKIIEGASDKSYGIHVARLAGVPSEALERAKEILLNLESQELDIHDRPALAARNRAGGPGKDGAGVKEAQVAELQLDLFHGANDKVLKDLKRLDTDRMTPLQALESLARLKSRIV
jgi:DNA mismatch repair protein MutS